MPNPKLLRRASTGRVFLLWLCWIAFVVVMYLSIGDSLGNGHSGLFVNIGYGGIVFALIIEFGLKKIRISNLITPNQQREWKYLFFAIPFIITSIGFSWFYDFTLYHLAPDYLQNQYHFMQQNPVVDTTGSIASIITAIISGCIVAPFGEEFLFRGIIFDKISHRWSVITGLLTSSLIFGVLHFSIVGATIFGIILCVLYLETESLFVPIGIHFINNVGALCSDLLFTEVSKTAPITDYVYQDLWLNIFCLVIGSVWLVWFIYSRRSYILPSYTHLQSRP